MPNKVTTIGGRLLQSDLILDNVRKEGLKDPMLEFNFDDTQQAAGKTLSDELKALIEKQNAAYAAQKQATRDLNAAWEITKKHYQKYVSICRQVMTADMFKDLGVTGKKKHSFTDWTTQARNFYNTALQTSGILQILLKYNITQVQLEEGLALLDVLVPLYNEQRNKVGLAQVATVDKDRKLAELQKWNSDFIFFAKLAHKDDKQNMERFNYTMYSDGYKPAKPKTTEIPAEEPPVEPPVEEPGSLQPTSTVFELRKK